VRVGRPLGPLRRPRAPHRGLLLGDAEQHDPALARRIAQGIFVLFMVTLIVYALFFAGVAAVCTTAFLIAALSIQQYFVAATLAILLGAVLGFLCFNFSPATIFMGDSGSLLIGFLLGALTILTTFIPKGQPWSEGWYAVFAPVIVLAVPLYDLLVVSAMRLLRGRSPFVGDTNHFSHRLVARGMSRRTAVLCLYLISASTSIAAILLPHVSPQFAPLIFLQTILILGVVGLLEQHPLPTSAESKRAANDP